MWARNLLFLGLVVAGVGALTAALFPRPTRGPSAPAAVEGAADVRPVVERVDAAFRELWQERELKPAPTAPELAVGRRLALGLMGTIPSLQEIRDFEAPTGDRLQAWLDAILRDPRFNDYFAERLARAYVGTADGPFIVYRRRRFVSWLSDQLARNRPYDEIVRDLIADRGLWTDRPATNFITVTVNQADGNVPDPERLASRVSRAFLGVRLDCAQCHNHPFERWKRDDFQGIAAFFGQVKTGLTGIHDDVNAGYLMEDRKTGEKVKVEPGVPFLPDLVSDSGTRRERLAAWVTHPNNSYFARATVNRVWAILCGRPLVEPVDDIPTAGDLPKALDLLAEDFVAHGFDLRRLIRAIASMEAFRLDSAAEHEITDAHEKSWAAFPLTRLRPEQVAGGVLQAAQVQTLNQESHALVRFIRYGTLNDFVKSYGDTGEDEFHDRGCTIPQVLLVMNGDLVKKQTEKNLFNAATRIGWQALDDRAAVEAAFLCVLTRRPTPEAAALFEGRLRDTRGDERSARMEDLYWALLNGTEFKWNH